MLADERELMEQCGKEKAEWLKKFMDSIRGLSCFNNIKDMRYVQIDDMKSNRTEWIYVIYWSGAQKRFEVTAFNVRGILNAFNEYMRHEGYFRILDKDEEIEIDEV